MSGARGGLGRILAMGVGLALALLLLLAAEARAGMYTVAQCGWYVGADADWADSTGGAKFRPDGFCVPAGGGDPFDGSRLKSLTRDGQGTVSGNRFARWRWTAPVGTEISQLRGTWWHALHDGMEQRIGVINWAGGFEPELRATATNTAPSEFVLGFPVPAAGIEDRLLCARAESGWCSLDATSWSGMRALTFTLRDISPPTAGIGGELRWGGWKRGVQSAVIWGSDVGSGVRFGETAIDGSIVARTEYPCAMASIGGEWRGTKMQPCLTGVSQTQSIDTTAFSDGPHSLLHCNLDFGGDAGCDGPFPVLIDNNPPAHPRGATVAGGEGWRRANGFEATWTNPDQDRASPIVGAVWRITGPAGFDTGAAFAAGLDRTALGELKLPRPGAYSLALWLRDEAGNEAPGTAVSVPLRFDDVPPGVAFLPEDAPSLVQAEVSDTHSGPAKGEILYRRSDSERWIELPTKLVVTPASNAVLRAPLPELGPGTYLFRADVADAAGNTASTRRRADGTEMAIRRVAPEAVARERTRLFARLRGAKGRGETRTVPFSAAATIGGRLTRVGGVGLAGRELRVLTRPSRGALSPLAVETVTTGAKGEFALRLPPGVSRRISVNFVGDGALEPSTRRPLELRVRSGVSLRADRTRLTTGQVLRLQGEVSARGAAIPRRGKVVAIQYLEEATGRWRPVVLTRTDHDGTLPGPLPLPLRQRRCRGPAAGHGAGRGALALRAGFVAPADGRRERR